MVTWVVWDILLRGSAPQQYIPYNPRDHVLTNTYTLTLHTTLKRHDVCYHKFADDMSLFNPSEEQSGTTCHCDSRAFTRQTAIIKEEAETLGILAQSDDYGWVIICGEFIKCYIYIYIYIGIGLLDAPRLLFTFPLITNPRDQYIC